jgi:hypothetical protein
MAARSKTHSSSQKRTGKRSGRSSGTRKPKTTRRTSRPNSKPGPGKKATRPGKPRPSSHATRGLRPSRPRKAGHRSSPRVARPTKGSKPKERVRRAERTQTRSSRDRDKKRALQARQEKQREQARLAKEREQARREKQREQARLTKERELARRQKQRERARLAKERELGHREKQRELEKAKELKEREAKQHVLRQLRDQERAKKLAERTAAKQALVQAREQARVQKSSEREAAKLARDEERQRAQVERDRQREEARRVKEEERARKEAEREAYRKAKEAERERLRAEREAARRALEGKVARATKRAHRADGLLGRSSTARLYRADAIPDQSGTTRRNLELEQTGYARFANLRPLQPAGASLGSTPGTTPLQAGAGAGGAPVAGPPATPAPLPTAPTFFSPPTPQAQTKDRLPEPEPEDGEPLEPSPESEDLEEAPESFEGDESLEEALPVESSSAPPASADLVDLDDQSELGSTPAESAEGEDVAEVASAADGTPPSTLVGPSPLPKFELATVEDRQASIEERLAQSDEEFRRNYLESLDMSWIYHDSALEGVVYTFQELKTAIDPNITVVPDSSLQPVCEEIRRHKSTIDLVRELAQRKKESVTVDTVKRIYLTLHPEEGDLKSVKYRKDIPQHRLYFHEYAAPDKIAYKVRQIIDWLNGPEPKKIKNPVRIAGRVHYDLLRVFPFPADSGKVARLLMNLILIRSGYPPAIIHSTERQRYYEALKGALPVILAMVNEAIQNGLQSIEKILDEQETRMRSFVS